jgi:hypothetical protein
MDDENRITVVAKTGEKPPMKPMALSVSPSGKATASCPICIWIGSAARLNASS